MSQPDPPSPPNAPEEPQGPERKSKSQRKREMHAVTELAERLITCPANILDRVPIPELVLEEIMEARRQTARTARKRQVRLVGKLLRTEDLEPMVRALAQLTSNDPLTDPHLASFVKGQREDPTEETAPGTAPMSQTDVLTPKAEAWRQRLLKEGDGALQALLDRYPEADRAHLRQLMRAAQKKPTGRAANKLGAAVRALLESEL